MKSAKKVAYCESPNAKHSGFDAGAPKCCRTRIGNDYFASAMGLTRSEADLGIDVGLLSFEIQDHLAAFLRVQNLFKN